MTVPFHNLVSTDHIKDEDGNRTFKISGSVTQADEGKAVSLDTTAPFTVKLAADGDYILGRLEMYETDNTVTVSLNFTDPLPIKVGQTIAVGDTLVGAGSGFVKTGTANPTANIVVNVDTVKGLASAIKY